MATLEILGFPQSNFVWAVRLAAAAKGVPHEVVPARPQGPELLEIHPYGRMPVMRHGAVKLAESRAIIAYIDSAFDGPALMPDDIVAAARAESWTSMVLTTIEPVIVRQYLFAHRFAKTADGKPDQARIAELAPEVERHIKVLDKAAADGDLEDGPISVPDCYLVPILFYARTLPESGDALAKSPHLSAYLDGKLDLAPVKETLPPPLP